VILALVLQRRLGGLAAQTRMWFLRVLAATVVTAVAAAVLAQPLAEATAPGAVPRILQLMVFLLALVVLALVYVASAWIFRIPELSVAFDQLSSRIPLLRLVVSKLQK
jgi:hypothetical protein